MFGRTLTLCVALLLLSAVPAQAKTESASAGPVSAKVSYARAADYGYRYFRLEIRREGRTLLSKSLRVPGCGSGRFCTLWPGGFGDEPTLHVLDLDGDGEPEVIVDTYTGGAHCCLLGFFYRFTGSGYSRIYQDFRDYGYKIKDLDGDGLPEVVGSDIRFIDAYTAHAFAEAPIAIFQFRAGKLNDVTSRFRSDVEADAAKLGKLYRHTANRHQEGRGVLAAYLADLFRLGRGPEARQILNRAVNRHEIQFGRSFRRSVLRDLHRWGYR